jgi:hypothetical protein
MAPMSQTERLYKLKSWLDAGKCLTKAALCALHGKPIPALREIKYLRTLGDGP